MSFEISLDGQSHNIEIISRHSHLIVRIDERLHEIRNVGDPKDGQQMVEIDGVTHHFLRAQAGDQQIIRLDNRTFETAIVDPLSASEGTGSGQNQIIAPMPGLVISVHKEVGDEVSRGETIVTIESMKLQTALTSPRDGLIADLIRAEGESFEKGELIVLLEEETGEA